IACPFLEQNTHLRVLIGFSGAGRRLVALAICLSLSEIADQKLLSEGRFVIASSERARRRGAAPRVVLLGLRAAATATGTAAAAAESAATAAAAARLNHLGGRIPQGRADLVNLDLHHGALLAL